MSTPEYELEELAAYALEEKYDDIYERAVESIILNYPESEMDDLLKICAEEYASDYAEELSESLAAAQKYNADELAWEASRDEAGWE